MKHLLILILAAISLTASAQEAYYKTVPYTMGFEKGTTDSIKVFDLNGKDGKNGYWKIMTYTGVYGDYQYFRSGLSALVYFYDSKRNADDWAILDPVKLTPGKYAVKFWYCNYSMETSRHPERVALYYGTAQTPDSMTHEVVKYDPFDVDEYTESVSVIDIKETGIYYFGFHCFSDKDENILMIDDFTIEAVEGVDNDVAVSEIVYPAYGYINSSASQNLSFTLTNSGTEDVSTRVTIAVDDRSIKSYPVNLVAQQTVTQNRDDIFSSVSVGTHKLTVNVTCDGDPDLTNNTLETTLVKVSDPTLIWNAEGGVVDSTITLHCYDTNVSSNTQTELFPNGIQWSTIELEEHAVFGSWMYICNTWFSNKNPTDADRWFVLPKVKINSADTHFTWNAESFNKNFLENYSLMISTEGDQKEAYTELLSVHGERATELSKHSIRGISLADYVGQTVNIAIRVTTSDGQILILDNLAFHGNVELLDEPSTEITSLTSTPTTSPLYNLRGQQVSHPTTGIYIQGGKKLILK